MDNMDNLNDDELQHHGIKGMKWGVRRYQNPDGSLTKAGKKRYDSELEKIRNEEKILKNKKSTKSKIDRLNARKQKLEDAKNEFEGKLKADKAKGKTNTKDNDTTADKSVSKGKDNEVSLAAKRQKILDSHDAETIFKNKDILSDTEIKAAISRLEDEKKLKGMIPEKESKGKKFVEGLNSMGKTAASLTTSAATIFDNLSKIKNLVDKFNGNADDGDNGDSDNKPKEPKKPKEKKEKKPKEPKEPKVTIEKKPKEPDEPRKPKEKKPVIYDVDFDDNSGGSSFVSGLLKTPNVSGLLTSGSSSGSLSSGRSFVAGLLEPPKE